jgi:hypothetical protein
MGGMLKLAINTMAKTAPVLMDSGPFSFSCWCCLPSPERIPSMTEVQFPRAVARATGETVRTIADFGFSPVQDEYDREPLTVDWDELAAQRYRVLPELLRQAMPA